MTGVCRQMASHLLLAKKEKMVCLIFFVSEKKTMFNMILVYVWTRKKACQN